VTFRCSVAAHQRDDPRLGSATPTERWLLIEQPGGWGYSALTESLLSRPVGAALLARSRETGLRPLLIRRPGRHPAVAQRSWAVVDSRPGSEQVRWGAFEDDSELVPLLEGVLAGVVGGVPSSAPLYLVCAHGRHDACCAIWGRPAAAALAALRPEATWECSHIGGCRFAANVVVLPQGLFYAWASPRDAGRLVAATERGEVVPRLLRGRSSLPLVAQAAQHLAREETGLRGVDDLPVLSVTRLDGHAWQVTLSGPGGPLVLDVHTGGSPPHQLTCRAAHPERAWTYAATARGDREPVPPAPRGD